MLKNYTTLDLSTYYKMVKDFEETNSDERDLVSYIHEKLSNPTNNLTKGDSPLKHSVYNYLGVNFVVAEVNSDYLLKGVIDGPQIITGLNFYPSTKLYFTLNNDYYLSIYYTDGHSRELKTLNYEKWNHSWSYLKTSFRRGLQALVDFASKPVSVDMFHLRDGHGFNITTSQFSPDYLVNTLTPKPGYEIKRLYYNSILIYDTDNGISKQIGLKNALENVIKVTFVPRLRPTLLYITSNTNSSILNKYYKITNAVNPNSPNLSKISLIKSINVFDYNSLLDTVKGVKEFLVDITDLHTTEDYRVSNHTVSTKAYAILTPNKDRNLVLLTQGKTTIWEAQDELTTEEYALDTLKLNKDKLMPFTLDLSTLLNKTVKNKDFMMNQYINLYRRKIYGLLFTIVKPSFSTYITAVKHDDKVLFDINADQSGVSDQSDRVLSVVYAFKDDPRILALNFVRNFVPSQAYFRKNDEGDWEEISSSEYGKFLFLLKRFTMNPVVLDLDSPNPNFFTIFTDRSNKNITMTRITPKDSYKIWKVVRSNSSNLFDPFKEVKLSDLHRRSVQSIEEVFSIQNTSVLYVEYTDGDPSLLRLYYNTDMLFQVRKAYFVLEDGFYKSTTEENFNHLLSLAKSAGTQVTYNLDPYYRHGSPSYRKDSYEEKVVTVYNDKFDLVYPNYEFNISPVMFKETKVWEARPHYQTLSIASYPSKNPNQMMYYKLTVGSGPSDEVVWKPSTLYSNPVFDRNVRSLDFDLTDTRVHSTLTVFSFEREGLYTTVVLPNNDTLVGSISIDKRKIWTPNYDESTSVSEKLVKFYFTPSVDPKILVVYYRDFKGYVRLKDFKRELSSFEWKESYSKFMSYYLDMLDSSFPLNLQSYDKSKFIFSTYSKYGFKIVSLYPLLSTNITKIFSKPLDPNSDVVSDVADSELIWRSEALENCFSLHFAPPEDPKVLLVYYSEKSVSKSSLYYKDSLNGWILDNENTHRQFINRLLDFQNAFVYHLEDSNLSLPSEFYTYEYTDVFGVRFGVCTPKPGKNLVAVTDKSMYVYEIKTGERILDVLSAQPNNPDHLIIILDTNVKESDHQTPLITYKYLKKVRSWVEVGENEFLDSLMGSMSTAFSPRRLTTKDLHNRVLAQLSVGTSYGTFMDSTKELSPPSDYEHFTLDLANYKENNRFTVKNYVESTVPRTVLRLKRGYLLTQLIHADQSIWTNGPNESSPSGNERFVTHVYFAPTEDPKVLTLFFRDSGSGVFSRRFVKNDVWTEFESLSHDLTNDSTLFTKLNKFVLDIHFDSVRYSSTIFKKELLYEDTTYFMKISPRDNVDVVKLVYKDSHLWDKGEFDNLKSVLVYPINCPKFAKILLSTGNGLHFFYFSRVNEFWSCTSEQEFKSSLKKYFSHSSEDFESVDLSNTKNYHNQTQKLNVHYANLHKLSFKSVSPRWDYKISKVVFGSPQPAGDSDLNDFDFGPFNFNTNTKTVDKDPTNSDLTVLFEPTSNEDIRLVSFSPEHDPKFVSITYTSTFNMIIPPTALPKLIDSPHSPNQSPEPVSGPTPPSSLVFQVMSPITTGGICLLHFTFR
ncbi:hypothetical protein TpMuguga_02g00762 [Theileria parva strain Muguga]|uniref:Uncharacterized protein n=1 Tax=Theileria parva TaxID=5875 RepID=Q4N477_THEPA|nr:uncharacterized protein TpMuguga_02g00762 [Theileria parva strain Muguga]EAN33046.1 hypothetical protein TpMuguga_02g00762 [Theileria parva strain Muguga]|eukprot:XP_765329.1 hypothetical protein [Theileria parva strain Muguga]